MNPIEAKYAETKDLLEQCLHPGPPILILEYLSKAPSDYRKLAMVIYRNNISPNCLLNYKVEPKPFCSRNLGKNALITHMLALFNYLSGYTAKKAVLDQLRQIQVFDHKKVQDDQFYFNRLDIMKKESLDFPIVEIEKYVTCDIERYFAEGALIKDAINRSTFLVLMHYFQLLLQKAPPQFQMRLKQIDNILNVLR